MANPWDKDPIVSVSAGNPWDKDPIVSTDKGSLLGDIKQGAGNLVAGAVRGAGSIGATLLMPVDAAARAMGVQNDFIGRTDRRTAMDGSLQSMGAETDSWMYQGGKLAGEIAGTAGVGSGLAVGARGLGAAPSVVNALATGGFRAGVPAVAPAGANLLAKITAAAPNMLTRTAGGAVAGGASAGLVDPGNAGFGAVVGGALPGAATAISKVSNKAGAAVRGAPVSGEVRTLAQRAKELKIDIPADRIVDSKPMNALASSLNYVPFSGRAATESKMASQLNQALSRTFGQDSSNVTQALRKADDVLGGQFDDFLRSNTVRVDDKFIDDLAEAASQASKELGSDGATIIGKQVDEIMAKAANGDIDGQAAYNIKKTLDRIGKRNSPEAWYAIDLKQKLMEALNRSVGEEKAAAFSTLRKQYGNMMSLEKLAKNGVEGEVSVAGIANMKNIRNPEIQELADISAQFLKTREAQHGAAQRAYGAMGAAAAGYFGGPATALAGMAAGRGANMLLNSKTASNAVLGLPNFGEKTNKLMEAGFRVAPTLTAR